MPVFIDSKKKRLKYDYRGNYLKHNPGILGRYFICSQCLKPMRRKGMEVDHIFPNSKWFSPNKVFNCVSICPNCNKKKSDKIGFCTVKGLVAKILEEVYIFLHKSLIFVFELIISLIFYLFKLLISGLTSGNLVRVGLSLAIIAVIFFMVKNVV